MGGRGTVCYPNYTLHKFKLGPILKIVDKPRIGVLADGQISDLNRSKYSTKSSNPPNLYPAKISLLKVTIFKKETFIFQPRDGLPTAQTCFFVLRLPPYSSKSIMADKLRYAINNCRAIDTDNYMLEQNNLFT